MDRKKQRSAKGRRAHSRRSPLRVSSRAGPGKPGSSRASSGGRRARGPPFELPCAPPPVARAPDRQPALATGYGGGGGGRRPRTRSSYSPGSDSDDFDLLVGGEAAADGDEKEQHISDYLAGFLSDGEYSIPMDGKEEDGLVDYAGKAVFTVRDHVAQGYKEYPTGCNDDATTYSDNDDQVFVENGPVTVVAAEEEVEEGALQQQQLDDAHQATEYYPVDGEAECYGNGTEEAINCGEDDGYYCQDGNSVEAAFNGAEDDGHYGEDDGGGGDWYDQGNDGDGYAHADDSYDPFY